MKNLIFLVLTAVAATAIGYAEKSTDKIIISLGRTSPSNGKQMYVSYCASCHGMDGKGNGPRAAALKNQPADLSVLSRNNGGEFPERQVNGILQFGEPAGAHETPEMPVWGPILNRIDMNGPQSPIGALRVFNLSRYLESLQVK